MRLTRSVFVAAMFGLSACTGVTGADRTLSSSQPPSTFSEVGRSVASHTHDDLLYVSDSQSNVYIYSYPTGTQVGKISGLDAPQGECVDGIGNVWVTMARSDEVVKYAHGGSIPVSTLSDPGTPTGCAVDPFTGNLAVTNYDPSTIEIYPQAQGSPASYSSPYFGGYYYCTYDGSGNLFADGGDQTGTIAELPYGGAVLESIALSQDLVTLSMQWDGSYISIVGYPRVNAQPDNGGKGQGPVQLYRVAVSGSSGTVVSENALKSPDGKHVNFAVQYWIAGKTIIGPGYYPQGGEGVLTWHYPKGHITHKIPARWGPWGVTLSRG